MTNEPGKKKVKDAKSFLDQLTTSQAPATQNTGKPSNPWDNEDVDLDSAMKDIMGSKQNTPVPANTIDNSPEPLSFSSLKQKATETQSSIENAQKSLRENYLSKFKFPASSPMGGGYIWDSKEQMDAFTKFRDADAKLTVAKNYLKRAQNIPEDKEGAGMKAFQNELHNIASLGISGLYESATTAGAARGMAKGGDEPESQTLIDAYGQLKTLTDLANKEIPRYRRASSIAGSVPYIEQFLLTGGIGSGAEAAATKVGTALIKKGINKTIATRIVQPIIEGGVSMVGRVPLSPATYQGIAEESLGDLTVDPETGGLVIDTEALPKISTAIAKGTYNSAKEIFSESLGGMVALPSGLFPKVITRAISPNVRKFFKMAGMNNPVGEYYEEMVSQALGGENPLDPEFLKDLIYTIPIVTGGFSMLSAPSIANNMRIRANNKEVIEVFGRDNVANLRDLIENGNNPEAVVNYIRGLKDKPELVEALDKDYSKLIRYAASLVQQKTEEALSRQEQSGLGYSNPSPGGNNTTNPNTPGLSSQIDGAGQPLNIGPLDAPGQDLLTPAEKDTETQVNEQFEPLRQAMEPFRNREDGDLHMFQDQKGEMFYMVEQIDDASALFVSMETVEGQPLSKGIKGMMVMHKISDQKYDEWALNVKNQIREGLGVVSQAAQAEAAKPEATPENSYKEEYLQATSKPEVSPDEIESIRQRIQADISAGQQFSPEFLTELGVQPAETNGEHHVIAADYLLNAGVGAVVSSDYYLQGLSGVFTRASKAIDDIRKKYTQQIIDANLTQQADFINSDLYSRMMSEIQTEINKAYNYDKEVNAMFEKILLYPTGTPVKVGTEISRRIDEINTQTSENTAENRTTDTQTVSQVAPPAGDKEKTAQKSFPVTVGEKNKAIQANAVEQANGTYMIDQEFTDYGEAEQVRKAIEKKFASRKYKAVVESKSIDETNPFSDEIHRVRIITTPVKKETQGKQEEKVQATTPTAADETFTVEAGSQVSAAGAVVPEPIKVGDQSFNTEEEFHAWLDKNYTNEERFGAVNSDGYMELNAIKSFNKWYKNNKQRLNNISAGIKETDPVTASAPGMFNKQEVIEALFAEYPEDVKEMMRGELARMDIAEFNAMAKQAGFNSLGAGRYTAAAVFNPVDAVTQRKEIAVNVAKARKKIRFKPGSRTGKVVNTTPNNFEEALMQFILSGGKISRQDYMSHTGFPPSSREVRSLTFTGIISDTGTKMDVLHESLGDESFGIENRGSMEAENAIVDVLNSFPSKGKMLAELERRFNEQQQEAPTDEQAADDMSPDVDVEDANPIGLDSNLMEIFDSKELMSIFDDTDYLRTDNGLPDWDFIRYTLENDIKALTQFPYGFNNKEILLLTQLSNDTDKQRSFEAQIQNTGSNQSKSNEYFTERGNEADNDRASQQGEEEYGPVNTDQVEPETPVSQPEAQPEQPAEQPQQQSQPVQPQFAGDMLKREEPEKEENNQPAVSPKSEQLSQEEAKVDPNPTEAQKEAGNYSKGHISIQGMKISIENAKGGVREGTDRNGKAWKTIMKNSYGYFPGTRGADTQAGSKKKDWIDVFLGENLDSDKVFIIDQTNPETQAFDEHKVMLGFNSKEEAEAAYLSNYQSGWKGLGAITEKPIDEFKAWLYDGKAKTKPVAWKEESAKQFTFMSNSPMHQARALAVLEKNIRADGKVLPIYQWIEEMPSGLKIEEGALYSSKAKNDNGKVQKRFIGEWIVGSKAEQDYYQYIQDGGFPYSEHLKIEKQKEAIKKEQQDKERKEKQEESQRASNEFAKKQKIAENELIKQALSGELSKQQFLDQQTKWLRDELLHLRGRKQSKEVTNEIAYTENNLQSRTQTLSATYDTFKDLYKLDNGEVVYKNKYKIGDEVIVTGWDKNTKTKIENTRENPDGSVTYIVEKNADIPNVYIGYTNLRPAKPEPVAYKSAVETFESAKNSPLGQLIAGVGGKFGEFQSRQAKVDHYQRLLETYEKKPSEKTKNEILKLEKELGYADLGNSYFDLNKPEQQSEPEGVKVEEKQPDLFMKVDKESMPTLQDFGEKIGGARKDMGITRTVRDKDNLPAWRRKYSYANADGTMVLGQDIDTTKPFIVQWEKEIASAWGGKRSIYRPVTTIETSTPKIFNSEEEAEAYIPIYEVYQQRFMVRKTGEGFVIVKASSTGKLIEYATFPTEEEAKTYMLSTEGATSLLNHKREDFSIPALDKVERTGKDWRNGRDVSTEEFMNTFGFRGGEFGNWVKPEERRVMLNAAYDSFMDLAEIMGVPAKAMSLGGELSIAFGARGTKGAAAHFEPDRAVINLTRMNGAGSLAHEWAHALDNYLGLQGARKDYSRNEQGQVKAGRVMRTEAGVLSIQGMRRELSELFDNIIEATQKKSVTRVMGLDEKQKAYDKAKERVKGEAESLVSKFENGVRRYQYNRKTKLREDVVIKATLEQISKLKDVLDRVLAGEGSRPTWSRIPDSKSRMGEYSYISPEMMEIEALHKEVFGKTGLKRDGAGFYNLGYYLDKLFPVKEQLDQAIAGQSETLKVSTDYLKNSKVFDRSRAKQYWSTPDEMFARAFEYYVETRLQNNNQRADYLQYDKAPVYEAVYGIHPYPAGEERDEINKAFERFFATLQTKEENGNTILFEPITEYLKQNDFHTIRLTEQVSPEDYDKFRELAARLGGKWYGSRENGNIPGFVFRSKENAQLFQTYLDNDMVNESSAEYVKTGAFKKWFKQSKVVDGNGKPLIVYHGTNRNFDSFRDDRILFFSPNPDHAWMYVAGGAAKGAHYVSQKEKELEARTAAGESIMPVYLSIQKPFDTRNQKERDIFLKEFLNKYGNGTPLNDENGLPDWTDAEDIQQFIEDKGYDYDGIILAESHGNITYAAFSPTQVKSATGNSGNYNPNNPNILNETSLAYPSLDILKKYPILAKQYEDVYGKSIQNITEEEVRQFPDGYNSLEERRQAINRAVAEATQRTIDFGWGEPAVPEKSKIPEKLRPRTVIEGFKESGYVDFTGQRIKGPQDIADLWSIHRSPYIEKSHAIFVKKGVIVGTTAGTANSPMATPFTAMEKIKDLYEKYGADGVYYLHNHPSGNPDPSVADVFMTMKHASTLKLFGVNVKGHVVIDTDKFSYINIDKIKNIIDTDTAFSDAEGYYTKKSYETYEYKNAVPKLFYERENIGNQGQDRMLEIAKALLTGKGYKGAIVYLSSKRDITAYDVFPEGADYKRVRAILNEGLKNNLGGRAILIHDGSYRYKFGLEALPDNVVDIIDTEKMESEYFSTKPSHPYYYETLWEDQAEYKPKGIKEIESRIETVKGKIAETTRQRQAKKNEIAGKVNVQQSMFAGDMLRPRVEQASMFDIKQDDSKDNIDRILQPFDNTLARLKDELKGLEAQLKTASRELSGEQTLFDNSNQYENQANTDLSYELSEETLDRALYDIKSSLNFGLSKDYERFGNTLVRVKDHTPDWANFNEDIERGINKIVNVTVGDYQNTDYRKNKTNLESIRKEHPEVEFVDIQVQNGDSIADAIKNIAAEVGKTSKDITRTENFKRWFGNSKVVDENGKPLVVYHGTLSDDEFDIKDRSFRYNGFYTSSLPEYANKFADGGKTPQGSVMPVYAKIENPLILNLPEFNSFGGSIATKDNFLIPTYRDMSKGQIELLKKDGHDGIIVNVDTDQLPKTSDMYGQGIVKGFEVVTFSPSQIKSATGNNGNFDPNDPNILHEEGREYKGGIPKTLYHSSVKGIESIPDGAVINELGIHLGSKETADKLSNAKGGTTRQYAVDLKNPLEVNDFARWEAFVVSRRLLGDGVISQKEYNAINKKTGNDKERELIKILKNKGYDGFVYDNYFEGGGRSYVVFDKAQLKPILPSENDILMEKALEYSKGSQKGAEQWLKDKISTVSDDKVLSDKYKAALKSLEDNLANDPPAPYNKNTNPVTPTPADKMVKSRWSKLYELIAQKMASVEILQNKVKERGGKITDESDIIIAENLAASTARAKIDEYHEKIFNPLLQTVKSIIDKTASKHGDKVIEKFDEYLRAKHSPERNLWMGAKNGRDQNADFTTEEAEVIILNYESLLDASEIDALWKGMNKATKYTLDKYLETGMMTKENYDLIKSMGYDHYVPLRGWKDSRDEIFDYQEADGTGDAYQGMKKAKGRTSQSAFVLSYVQSMANSAIVAGEKNKVKQAAARLVLDNKKMNDMFRFLTVYTVDTGDVDANGDPITYDTVEKPDNQLWEDGKVTISRNRDHETRLPKSLSKQHVIHLFMNGQKVALAFTDPAVANAINNKNQYQPEVTRYLQNSVGRMTRWMSANFTAKNPAFMPINQLRDLGYAVVSHSVKYESGMQFLSNLKKARAAIIRATKGQEDIVNNPVDKLHHEWVMSGGRTGYIHLDDVKNIEKEVVKDLNRVFGNTSAWDKAMQARLIKNGGKLLDNLATRSEDLSRFATYLTMLENGYSHIQAVKASKDITVNFNTKGRISGALGSVFAFFNASVQGGVNIGSMAYKHKGKFAGVAAGFMALGFLNALLASLWSDEDENGDSLYYAEGEWVRHNNLTIPAGRGFVTIPMPFGFRSFFAIGASTHDMIYGKITPVHALANSANSVFESLSPVNPTGFFGTEGDLSARPVIPTFAVPWYDLATNENFAGKRLYQLPYTTELDKKLAESQLGLKYVSPYIKASTDAVFKMAGGEPETKVKYYVNEKGVRKVVPGVLDINPSKVEHLFDSYLGGRFQFWNQALTTTTEILKGSVEAAKDKDLSKILDDVPLNTVPVLRRLYQEPWEKPYWQKYYSYREDIEQWSDLKTRYSKVNMTDKQMILEKQDAMQQKAAIFKAENETIKDLYELAAQPGLTPEVRQGLISERENMVRTLVKELELIDQTNNK